MSNRYVDHLGYFEDLKDNISKSNLNKYEYDLYQEEDNNPGTVIQVKKVGNLKKGEKWKILKDNKLVLTIDGSKLTSKERSFLYTAEGTSFLIKHFKLGNVTITSLKKEIKTILNDKAKIE